MRGQLQRQRKLSAGSRVFCETGTAGLSLMCRLCQDPRPAHQCRDMETDAGIINLVELRRSSSRSRKHCGFRKITTILLLLRAVSFHDSLPHRYVFKSGVNERLKKLTADSTGPNN